MRKLIFALATHGIALFIGFAGGIFMLPILTAPPTPDAAVLQQMADEAEYSVTLKRDLRGNDFLHWGEGTLSLSKNEIIHQGELSPGPDFKLYLINQFVEHEDEFLPLKDAAQYIGDVKTFKGFALSVPETVDVSKYTTVVIWCEAFGEFITAGQYR